MSSKIYMLFFAFIYVKTQVFFIIATEVGAYSQIFNLENEPIRKEIDKREAMETGLVCSCTCDGLPLLSGETAGERRENACYLGTSTQCWVGQLQPVQPNIDYWKQPGRFGTWKNGTFIPLYPRKP